MVSIAQRLAIFAALAVLLPLSLLSMPQGAPAQPAPTTTAVPATSTALPPTSTLPSTATATATLAPTETATTIPVATAVPTEPPESPTAPATSVPPTETPLTAANHSASITPLQGTVNSWVTYTLADFPANATVTIRWQRNTGSIFAFGTTTTDAAGGATGRFRVPAVTGGENQPIHFTSGTVSKRVYFDVRPRIKILTQPAECGQPAEVSLRGYAKKETVRIRWEDPDGSGWVQVGTVLTSNTGSANLFVTVPPGAQPGFNSVRGDGTSFRQQTNVAFVQCG